RRLVGARLGPAVRPPALTSHQVLEAVAVDVHEVQGVRFGAEVLEQVRPQERRRLAVAALEVAPDAELVGRAAEDVGPAVPVGAGPEPGHLALILFTLRLPAHDQDALAVAEQIDVLRRLVAGALPDEVFLPVPRLAARVLVPVAGGAREADDDQVRPAVVVDI